MKRINLFAVIFLIFCLSLSGVIHVWAVDDAPEQPNISAASMDNAPEWPGTSAASAVVIDARTGRMLYEKNADMKQYMASTTKIMTCLLALEAMTDKEELIKISQTAANQEGSSIYMEAGEKISFEDLIYALMMRSGNDAAVALAEWVAGSEEDFAALMNKRAVEMGAMNTHFVTASGLHDDDHYTTAKDLALITFEAMKNPIFKEVVSTGSWNAKRAIDKMNYFYNKNKVLYQYEGGNGVKIGYTKAAGRCLVASSQREGIELICVVLSAGDWFNDSYKLMDTVYENYEAVKVAAAGIPLKTINVENGTKGYTKLVAKSDAMIPLTASEKETLQMQFNITSSVSAPIARGDVLGTIDLYIHGVPAGEIDLIAREDIPSKEEVTVFSQIF